MFWFSVTADNYAGGVVLIAGQNLATGGRLTLPTSEDQDKPTIIFKDPNSPIGFTPLMEAARDGHADVVSLLLARGADATRRAARNGLELTALHLAAAAGKAGVVRQLVDHRAPIDALDSELATPLLWATNQQPDIAVLLVELGADADLAPRQGTSPRQIATERKMEKLLAALAARAG